MSLVFALFTAGYILGVWTACVVFRQSQSAYEDGAPWLAADQRLIPGEPVLVQPPMVELRLK
jgi:hypothetical protein